MSVFLVLTTTMNSNMELGSSSPQHQNLNEVVNSGQKLKRCNSRRDRIKGNKIDDYANGKTCHQCRQKTSQFAATCKNLKKGKPCPLKFCHKCLLTRYGQIAEEVAQLGDWTCPKCRDLCNCSCCQRKRGEEPTGPLFRTAKAAGFKSVSEMLHAKASKTLQSNMINDDAVMPSNEANVEKDLAVLLSGELGKENSSDGTSGLKIDPLNVQKASSPKRSSGSSVDGAGKKKSLERPKICKEVPCEEAKGNGNDKTKVCNEVSEKETKVDNNYDTACVPMDCPEAWAANDFCLDLNKLFVSKATTKENFHAVSELQTQVHGNQYTNFGDTANNFIGPVTLAPKESFFNSKYRDTMKHIHGENVGGDNAGAMFQGRIARFPNDGMNLGIPKIEEEIPLPPGTELTEILDIKFPPEDIGNALQLLEFCRVFGEALDLKKGEAEAILQELVCTQGLYRGRNTILVQFQVRVLNLILIGSKNESSSLTSHDGNDSWLKHLKDLITESEFGLKYFPFDWVEEGIKGFYNLALSKKLTLLNFLCDEALRTKKLRNFIDEQNSRHAKEMKAAKSNIAAAKEKERGLRQKLRNEMAKVVTSNVAPFPIKEHDALLTKIKIEMAEAHAEMLELKGKIPKGKHSSDATRTEPEFLDSNGHTFWKIKGYNGEYSVLLQDIKIVDETATKPDEKWFVYGPEKKDEVDKYISSRAKKLQSHKVSHMLSQ